MEMTGPIWMEPVAIALALFSWGQLLFRAQNRRRVFSRILLVMTLSWLTEETCIHLYGFYQYHSVWKLMVDVVPLAVILIWPVVMITAWDLARALASQNKVRHRVLLTAGIVLSDAAFIEPLAVSSNLWSWNEAGIFNVPLIGILGWSLFALFMAVFFAIQEDEKKAPMTQSFAVLLVPGAVHLALLALWWVFFRWTKGAIPDLWAIIALAVVGFWATAMAMRHVRADLESTLIWQRFPGALFFFVLLAFIPPTTWWLWIWAACFSPPYLALALQSLQKARTP
jgi:hypothetical protein